MRKNKPEDELDRYLGGDTVPDDHEMRALMRVADRLEHGLRAEAPDAYGERALFASGVSSRRRGIPWFRIMAPITAAAVFVAFLAISRTALPGDRLYSVRKALGNVGLAESPTRTAANRIESASDEISSGEKALEIGRFQQAKERAYEAIAYLSEAKLLLDGESGDRVDEQRDVIADLKEEAADVITEADDEQAELREEQRERAEEEAEEEREDNSGKGGGGDDSDDDNSGRGSGDDSGGDDNSGPGSDDSGGDDDSGSGSDDSSGSGSGGGDNSGSGSDDSGGDDD